MILKIILLLIAGTICLFTFCACIVAGNCDEQYKQSEQEENEDDLSKK